MSPELGRNLILRCYYELLFGDKFKQSLTKSFFWVSEIFLCWKRMKVFEFLTGQIFKLHFNVKCECCKDGDSTFEGQRSS
jgi:hypothetical protein